MSSSGQSAVERAAGSVPSVRMPPKVEIRGTEVAQELWQLISTLADLMPRSTIIYRPSRLPRRADKQDVSRRQCQTDRIDTRPGKEQSR